MSIIFFLKWHIIIGGEGIEKVTRKWDWEFLSYVLMPNMKCKFQN